MTQITPIYGPILVEAKIITRYLVNGGRLTNVMEYVPSSVSKTLSEMGSVRRGLCSAMMEML